MLGVPWDSYHFIMRVPDMFGCKGLSVGSQGKPCNVMAIYFLWTG